MCPYLSLSLSSYTHFGYFVVVIIHPSIDQQWSHGVTEHMTSETLYTNQTSSLKMGSPVLLSVTPSTNVSIQVVWGNFIISGVKTPWTSSFTSSSKGYCTVYTMLSVEFDRVIRNVMSCRYWHTPVWRSHHPPTFREKVYSDSQRFYGCTSTHH